MSGDGAQLMPALPGETPPLPSVHYLVKRVFAPRAPEATPWPDGGKERDERIEQETFARVVGTSAWIRVTLDRIPKAAFPNWTTPDDGKWSELDDAVRALGDWWIKVEVEPKANVAVLVERVVEVLKFALRSTRDASILAGVVVNGWSRIQTREWEFSIAWDQLAPAIRENPFDISLVGSSLAVTRPPRDTFAARVYASEKNAHQHGLEMQTRIAAAIRTTATYWEIDSAIKRWANGSSVATSMSAFPLATLRPAPVEPRRISQAIPAPRTRVPDGETLERLAELRAQEALYAERPKRTPDWLWPAVLALGIAYGFGSSSGHFSVEHAPQTPSPYQHPHFAGGFMASQIARHSLPMTLMF